MKNFTKALLVAGVAVSMSACAAFSPDNSNYVEDVDGTSAAYQAPAKDSMDRSARIERAYNDSLRK